MTMGEFHVWTARTPETGELVGEISTSIRSTGSNEHVAWFDVFGLPEFRSLGVASMLLEPTVAVARKADRRLLMPWSHRSVAAGEAFAKRLGARWGATNSISRLELADLDRELMATWHRRASERASEYTLGFLDGAPEDEIETFVSLAAVMNTAPRDNL